ncbi:MAG: putative bifunctional diguanylate cyclase/phosphodiesterase [Gibbsiella quercinecans]|uniref:putative bifunctional diguanylate cyclase/phosphodiesterase n=1 Tax=Gibbsiella quercinecans TaxID=929813 RepID=UPI003F35C1CD
MDHLGLSDLSYRHFVENVKDYAIYMLNPDGAIASWNLGAQKAKGYTSEEIVGQFFGIFYSESEQRAGLPEKNLAVARLNGKFEGEGWRYRKDGSRFWAHVMIDTIHDEQGTLLGFAKITRDISEQKQMNDRMHYMARYDALTGLPNRLEFFTVVEKMLAEAPERNIAICTIDVDKFKEINDREGHHTGDLLLQQTASRIRQILSDDEIVARFGGDEFVAAKPFSDKRELEAFVHRLHSCFAGHRAFAQTELVVNASIGVSVYPDDATEINKLIGNSDLAMYRAKHNINEKICYYVVEMDDKTRQRNQIAADIRTGLQQEQFYINYHEKYSLKDGTVTGYEALLRWNHPRLGPILPEVFIVIAEESGAIISLGYWVIEHVCREALNNKVDKKISVNISPVQLRDPVFIDKVREILMRTAYPPTLLEFEVTETAFITNKQLAFNLLHQLQKMGISIALDDFGTGYSSLSMLRDFNFDVIKLDRSFVSNVESNFQTRSFVRAMVTLSHSLKTPVVAEGVETREQLRILEEEGCQEIQGFLFGQPVGIEDLRK